MHWKSGFPPGFPPGFFAAVYDLYQASWHLSWCNHWTKRGWTMASCRDDNPAGVLLIDWPPVQEADENPILMFSPLAMDPSTTSTIRVRSLSCKLNWPSWSGKYTEPLHSSFNHFSKVCTYSMYSIRHTRHVARGIQGVRPNPLPVVIIVINNLILSRDT